MATNTLNLTIHFDADYEGWIVREASHAFARSSVPMYRSRNGERATVHYAFDTKAEATEQVRRLNLWAQRGGEIEFSRFDTPALFEAVADTKYGCAWN